VRRAVAVLALVLAGCGGDPPAAPPPPAAVPAAAAPAVVATIDGRPVTTEDLDAALRLPLHDLEVARHALRLAELDRRLAGHPEARTTVRLDPPPPPVVAMSPGDHPARGDAAAPVTIVEFLDFASPECRRMLPVVERLRGDYGRRVRVVVRDFPQPGHRDARRAAEAAGCAGEQGAYWAYHDALLRGPTALPRDVLEDQAAAAGIDVGVFEECLDGGRTRADVEADVAEAHRLGVPGVPVFFVNGRYLRGPVAYETLRRRVDAELDRVGVQPPAERTPVADDGARRTRLPLALVGIVVHDDPAESTAMLRVDGAAPAVFGPGDPLLDGVVLEAIEAERVLLRARDGTLEYLPAGG
jgi:protein-disulfide isomerase